jgi:hypothetical protein
MEAIASLTIAKACKNTTETENLTPVAAKIDTLQGNYQGSFLTKPEREIPLLNEVAGG